MFQETIKPAMKKKVNNLEENQTFLTEILNSLIATFIGQVKWDRNGNLRTSVDFFTGNGYGTTLTFDIDDKGISFSSELRYHLMPYIGLKEESFSEEPPKGYAYRYEGRYKYVLTGKKLPKWCEMKRYGCNGAGSSYGIKFSLNKTDKNLKKKIEMISTIIQAKGFKIRFDAVN